MENNGHNASHLKSQQLPSVVETPRRRAPETRRTRGGGVALFSLVVLGGAALAALRPPGHGDATSHLLNAIARSTTIYDSDFTTDDTCLLKSSVPRLLVRADPVTGPSDHAEALGLTIDGASAGAHLIIGGFASGSQFSAGRSIDETAWAIPASMIEATTILPPRGFVGSMHVAVTLMLSDGTLADHQTLNRQWLSPTSPLRRTILATQHIDTVDLQSLLARGDALAAAGDVASARLLFQRATDMGDSRAAFRLAQTYDPLVVDKLLSAGADVTTARIWYAKANDLGFLQARERLERLARW